MAWRWPALVCSGRFLVNKKYGWSVKRAGRSTSEEAWSMIEHEQTLAALAGVCLRNAEKNGESRWDCMASQFDVHEEHKLH